MSYQFNVPLNAPLPYRTNAEIVAAFKAGFRFEVIGKFSKKPVRDIRMDDMDGLEVSTGKTVFRDFMPWGRRPGHKTRMVALNAVIDPKVELFPKLPYKTAAEVAEAFADGVEFHIVGAQNASLNGKVRKIEDVPRVAGFYVYGPDGGSPWGGFAPDGTHALTKMRLVRIPGTPKATWHDPVSKPALYTASDIHAAAKAERERNFNMREFVLGKPAYCGKTGETATGITFSTAGIHVTLKAADGTLRVSMSYRHDGTHKHDSARNLTFTAPVKPKRRIDMRCEVGIVQTNGYRGLPGVKKGDVLTRTNPLTTFKNPQSVGAIVSPSPATSVLIVAVHEFTVEVDA